MLIPPFCRLCFRVNVYLRRVKTGVNVSLITNVTGSIAIAQMGSKENTAKKVNHLNNTTSDARVVFQTLMVDREGKLK